MSSIYSNVYGDFTATPNPGTKTITFADFASGVISGDLNVMNFIRAEVYEIFANGGITKIPLTSMVFDTDTLTISNMTANFKDGDTVAVYIEGRDKGFDEVADEYKTNGGGGGGTGDVNVIEVGGAALALGQALAADSLPIVLTAAQISTLTPPAAISNFANETGGNLAAIAATKVAGSFYMSSALALSGVVKASAGTLLACNGRLDLQANTGQYFLQFYDSAAVPADGAVTILHCETIEHVNNFSTDIEFEYPRGKAAAAGISFCLSTTEFTKTEATGEGYLSLEVEYK